MKCRNAEAHFLMQSSAWCSLTRHVPAQNYQIVQVVRQTQTLSASTITAHNTHHNDACSYAMEEPLRAFVETLCKFCHLGPKRSFARKHAKNVECMRALLVRAQ